MMKKSRLYWNFERCLEESKKYNSSKEWKLANESSYKSACDNKWLEECRKHMVTLIKGNPRKYTFDECKNISKNFNSREEWKKKHNSSYKCSILAGWYKKCVEHMIKLKGNWNNIDACKKIALKYKTKSDWRKRENSSYTYASKNGWIEECCNHMTHATRENSIEKDILRLVQKSYKSANSKRFKVEDKRFLVSIFELDICIPELNKGIEFDGKYWHSIPALQKRFPKWSIDQVKNYHNYKDDYFSSIGIKVLHIKEEDWIKNKQVEIEKISSFISCREA